jgi:hypothetical protein
MFYYPNTITHAQTVKYMISKCMNKKMLSLNTSNIQMPEKDARMRPAMAKEPAAP